MRPQTSRFLSALCLLLFTAPILQGAPTPTETLNTTVGTAGTTVYSTRGASPTTAPDYHITTEGENKSTISSTKDSKHVSITLCTSATLPLTTSLLESRIGAGEIVGWLLLIIALLFILSVCAYKWYTYQGRRSFQELRTSVVESVGPAWEAAMELLRPSRKQDEEEEEEEEEGTTEGQEQEKRGGDDNEEDEHDDSSDDYSSMDGTAMMRAKKEEGELEDGRSKEIEEDMTSVDLKEEDAEREKNDLTVL